MKKILISILFLGLTFSLSGQSLGFLAIHPDAATAGMAGTSVGQQANAYAPDNNMAAAALSTGRMDLGAGYTMWMPGISKNGILTASGYFKLTDRLALGADWKNFSSPSYAITSPEGRSTTEFTPKEFSIGLGASFRIVDGLAAGLHVKMASSSLAKDAKGSAFGADISLKYEKDALQAGLSADNIGGKVKYGNSAYPMPLCIRGGAAYTFSGLTAAVEADYLDGGVMAGAGLQYSIKDIAFVRAGYHYGKAIPSYASLGLGLQFAGIHADFFYLLASETLKNTLGFGLGYRF